MIRMPYDEKSFLSGLAAGRNVQSWPVANETKGDIVLLMDFPFNFHGIIAGTNIDIDWGIDSVLEPSRYQHIDDASSGVAISHSYATAGAMWLVKFSGNITNFKCYDDNYPYIWADSGIYGVLTPMPETMSTLTDCSKMFYGCNRLAIVHPQLFDSLTNVESFELTFGNCHINTIPIGLFRRNTRATNFKQCFKFSGLSSVPLDIFDSCPNINDLTECFYGSSITSAVPELWNTYPNAAHYGCFGRNPDIANWADIPADWKQV